jgi:hypothetical protein
MFSPARSARSNRSCASCGVKSHSWPVFLSIGFPVMSDHGLRRRVERLLRGEGLSDDLVRLFLYIRDRSDGRESIQEIGDFVAHHGERTKGIVTRTVRDWVEILRFYVSIRKEPGDTPLQMDATRLPARIPAFLAAIMRRTRHHVLIDEVGIPKSAADRMVARIITAMAENADGTYRLGRTSPDEMKILHYLLGSLIVQPAFTEDRLYDDFAAALKSNGLLRKDEIRTFSCFKTRIGLFAASMMHGCTIVHSDDSRTKLYLMTVPSDGIQVICSVDAYQFKVATDIFMVKCDGPGHCTERLIESMAGGTLAPDLGIELDASGQLDLIY